MSLRKRFLLPVKLYLVGKTVTTPNTETLKLLSKLFDVSINTLLGSPRKLICQCCGMPLDDSVISKECDGMFNEDYCKWCYADGQYMYQDMDNLIDVCVNNMSSENFPPDKVREYLKETLPQLDYWKKYTYWTARINSMNLKTSFWMK